MFERALRLPSSPKESFFLWGPRQVGKSTLLKTVYPDARRIDLLRSDQYLRYLERPALLREELDAEPETRFVIVDEVQKVPALLDEVHALIEDRGVNFALCGSSARKLRRGHANLLGGRALRHELCGLVSKELGANFELGRMLNRGNLPRHYESDEGHRERLRSYVADYLTEEVAAEGLVRNLQPFSRFLSAAALSDAELVNFSTIARDTGVSSPTVKQYFEILEDTLLGHFLPAYTKKPKRRVIGAPKFYFADVGVVNHLAKRGPLESGSELYGKAFESWVMHELRAYSLYSGRHLDLAYWRLAGGTEVDFIVGAMACAIEAKASSRITSDHLKGLRSLFEDHPKVKRRIVVSLESRPRKTEDGIDILPALVFAERLWADALV